MFESVWYKVVESVRVQRNKEKNFFCKQMEVAADVRGDDADVDVNKCGSGPWDVEKTDKGQGRSALHLQCMYYCVASWIPIRFVSLFLVLKTLRYLSWMCV